ncbi:hypothetical protein jhhlp_001044 [Lomentospora prolificans]|uniref:Peptide hydrolase n=1 Tax=Lomentospora prolificans TaxID=41688 RepID=A0A2N3NKE3_9PEZI|nr:hypothetical protein jhhlp_001044 [Lomentospora prolificans]
MFQSSITPGSPGLARSALRVLVSVLTFLNFTAAYQAVSDDVLRAIPSAGSDFDIKNGALLAPILIPRVPGTENSLLVQHHFINFFKQNLPKWSIELHNTSSTTPTSGKQEIPFVNLIFRRDPPWAAEGDVSRLTLVAHYDSKVEPEGFIGATDSAVPCAVLMHVARSLDDALTKKWDAMQASGEAGSGLEEETGVQIVLLDGEEAFVSWTSTDSLYGARALAESWDTEFYPAASQFKSPLRSISLFVLLDLLGSITPWPRVPSYFLTTHWAYQAMANVEKRLRDLGSLQTKPPAGTTQFLPDSDKKATSFNRGYIEDDHIPFMARGVEILHIIPSPFPDQWHDQKGIPDDAEHLDIPSSDDWAKIVTGFVAEWMELDSFLPKAAGEKRAFKTEL